LNATAENFSFAEKFSYLKCVSTRGSQKARLAFWGGARRKRRFIPRKFNAGLRDTPSGRAKFAENTGLDVASTGLSFFPFFVKLNGGEIAV
jgi:hypothetical protein